MVVIYAITTTYWNGLSRIEKGKLENKGIIELYSDNEEITIHNNNNKNCLFVKVKGFKNIANSLFLSLNELLWCKKRTNVIVVLNNRNYIEFNSKRIQRLHGSRIYNRVFCNGTGIEHFVSQLDQSTIQTRSRKAMFDMFIQMGTHHMNNITSDI